MTTIGVNLSHHASICIKDNDNIEYYEEDRFNKRKYWGPSRETWDYKCFSKIKDFNSPFIFCSFDSEEEYEKDIIKCMDKYYENQFNETNHMMIGKYGGITFEDYFIDNILKNKSSKTIDKYMYILFQKMEMLFIGLKSLYDNKIIHLDIKVNNIVIHEDVFKYIDFGLSSELSDKGHFERRSSSEFNGKRI